MTLGHEVAGRRGCGGRGRRSRPGWAPSWHPRRRSSTCGLCRWCRTGRPMLCAERLSIGSGVDGGFAAHVVVPARLLHRLPDVAGRPCRGAHGAARLRLQRHPGPRRGPGGRHGAGVRRRARGHPRGPGREGVRWRGHARGHGCGRRAPGPRGDAGHRAVDVGGGRRGARDARGARDGTRPSTWSSSAPAWRRRCGRAWSGCDPAAATSRWGCCPGWCPSRSGSSCSREIEVRATFGSSPAAWMRAVELVAQRAVDLGAAGQRRAAADRLARGDRTPGGPPGAQDGARPAARHSVDPDPH